MGRSLPCPRCITAVFCSPDFLPVRPLPAAEFERGIAQQLSFAGADAILMSNPSSLVQFNCDTNTVVKGYFTEPGSRHGNFKVTSGSANVNYRGLEQFELAKIHMRRPAEYRIDLDDDSGPVEFEIHLLHTRVGNVPADGMKLVIGILYRHSEKGDSNEGRNS
jgi:hypothetical protein